MTFCKAVALDLDGTPTSAGRLAPEALAAIDEPGVAAWEDELEAHRTADLERIRYKLIRAVEERYLPAPELR
ncbi:hypothetical protein [Mycobacterium camsae]|uniref:hypothetical protein n=1 Tax=Mycobacterium gordonae TaxID=1778 RepID=UPI00197F7089|nr:hypothetical protein [Mycobacterium gordonae]